MKRLNRTRLLIAAVLLLLAGCSKPAHDPTEKYVLVATNIKVPYWQNAAAGLVQAAKQMNVGAEMVGPDSYDPKAQLEAMHKAIAAKPAGILVSAAESELLRPAVDQAIGQGIPVIAIDSDARGSKRLLFIGTENHAAGTMGGDLVAKRLNGKGNVVIYTIPGQDNLRERLHGYEAAFSSHPQIKVVQTVDVKGDPRIAFDRTVEIVEKNAAGVDAFICLEATACPEVAEVLDRNKVKGKLVMAMDTDQRTLEWIQKGLIAATVAQKPFTMAYYGVKVLDDLHHNKPQTLDKNWAQDTSSTLPTFVDTGAVLVDQSNVSAFQRAPETAGK
jgi:ribose transport system substrate-binding protein